MALILHHMAWQFKTNKSEPEIGYICYTFIHMWRGEEVRDKESFITTHRNRQIAPTFLRIGEVQFSKIALSNRFNQIQN